MRKYNKKYSGFTLIEMLVVMAIVITLGGFGTGGFIGFRETMTARENVQTIMQDIQRARSMAMNVEKEKDDPWLYGIGMSFVSIDYGAYANLKWCSEFSSYGAIKTKSTIPAWDPSEEIKKGTSYTEDICVPTTLCYDMLGMELCSQRVCNKSPEDCPIGPYCKKLNPIPSNGYLSQNSTTSCESNQESIVILEGDTDVRIIDVDDNSTVISDAKYVVFEAVTGKAFLYNTNGEPTNYTGNAEYTYPEKTLDIVLSRRFSSKFDMISIYPLSGALVHHVYSDSDKVPASSGADSGSFFYGGNAYDRYTVADEINSYR